MNVILKPTSHPQLGDINIAASLFVIGRSEPPFTSHDDSAVAKLSAQHAHIYQDRGNAYLVDLGSRNGTKLNGRAVEKAPMELHDGDEVCFAAQLYYKVQLPDNAREETELQRASSLVRVTLVPEKSDTGLETITIDRFPFPINRDTEVFARYKESFPVEINYLSRDHACLVDKDGDLYLEDLGSTNGTWVGGTRLEAHAEKCLQDGDSIVFGCSHFSYTVKVEKEDIEDAKDDDQDELLARVRASLRKKQAIERHITHRDPGPSKMVLARSPLFKGLSPEILEEILNHMRLRHFDVNEFLIHQGQPADSVFIIQDGLVEVLIEESEGMKALERLRQEDVVGEMALVTGEPHTASVMAVTPTDALELDQETFTSLVKRYPLILLNASRISRKTMQRLMQRQPTTERNVTSSSSSLLKWVFISHSSSDKETADTVCRLLEAQGIDCWVAPRDVSPGAKYGEAIVHAIESSIAIVLIFSRHANASQHVMNEVERAVSQQKLIFPLRIDQTAPSSELAYFISRPHWLDASTNPLETVVKQLATALHSLDTSTTSSPRLSPNALQEAEPICVLEAPPESDLYPELKQPSSHRDKKARFVAPSKETTTDWNPTVLKTVEEHLAKYIGPVAKTLVQKEAKKAINIDELCQSLAEYIAIDQEKDLFLHKNRTHK